MGYTSKFNSLEVGIGFLPSYLTVHMLPVHQSLSPVSWPHQCEPLSLLRAFQMNTYINNTKHNNRDFFCDHCSQFFTFVRVQGFCYYVHPLLSVITQYRQWLKVAPSWNQQCLCWLMMQLQSLHISQKAFICRATHINSYKGEWVSA